MENITSRKVYWTESRTLTTIMNIRPLITSEISSNTTRRLWRKVLPMVTSARREIQRSPSMKSRLT